jgi:hypothetical protein
MDAGREMDALVAVHVMGWQFEQRPPDVYMGYIDPRGSFRLSEEIPAYSTDINRAWLVVERITRPPETPEEAHRAANTRFGFWWGEANLWAYTSQEAAHAICLAALRANGVEL